VRGSLSLKIGGNIFGSPLCIECGGKEGLLIFPSWWNDMDVLVVIDVGIDEGGSGDTFVVSGIIGQTSHMKKLDRKWKETLKWYGVDYFHGKEHWNRRARPYHGINVRKRRALLTELVRLIHKYAHVGVTVYVNEHKYKP
jgi:hypothetical protein